MDRVLKEELRVLFQQCNIPKVKLHFKDPLGRLQLFKEAIAQVSNLKGLYLEFGTMSGGTINQIASLIPDKKVYGFDSFQGLSEDYTDQYHKGVFKYSLITTANSINPNVELVVGWFEDTLERFLDMHKEKVIFVHMDADIYSSTYYVLDILAKRNRLQTGTVIQFDNLFYTESKYWYNGEFKAWQEILTKYSIKADYFLWAGYEHCSFIIKEIGERKNV